MSTFSTYTVDDSNDEPSSSSIDSSRLTIAVLVLCVLVGCLVLCLFAMFGYHSRYRNKHKNMQNMHSDWIKNQINSVSNYDQQKSNERGFKSNINDIDLPDLQKKTYSGTIDVKYNNNDDCNSNKHEHHNNNKDIDTQIIGGIMDDDELYGSGAAASYSVTQRHAYDSVDGNRIGAEFEMTSQNQVEGELETVTKVNNIDQPDIDPTSKQQIEKSKDDH